MKPTYAEWKDMILQRDGKFYSIMRDGYLETDRMLMMTVRRGKLCVRKVHPFFTLDDIFKNTDRVAYRKFLAIELIIMRKELKLYELENSNQQR